MTKLKKSSGTGSNLRPLDFIDDLHLRQLAWEKDYHRTTTAKLLALLADCMEARDQLASSPLLMRQMFANKVDTLLGAQSAAKLTLVGKIVRYVFRVTGQRASAYCRVIETARAEGIASSGLAAWVQEQGGIEAVRRKKRKDALSPADTVRQAALALASAKPLLTVANIPTSLHANPNNDHDFSLALIRHDPANGSGGVVSASTNKSLIRQYLLSVAKEVVDEKANQETAAAGADALIAKVEAREAALSHGAAAVAAEPSTEAA